MLTLFRLRPLFTLRPLFKLMKQWHVWLYEQKVDWTVLDLVVPLIGCYDYEVHSRC